MNTPTRLILMASIGTGLALGQDAERNNPPTPDRPPTRPVERPPGADLRRPESDRPRPEGDRPRPDGDRPPGDRERVRRDGDRPPGDGDGPRGEGGERRGGDARPEGDRPRQPGERAPGDAANRINARPSQGEGSGGSRRDVLMRIPEKLQPYVGIITRDASPELAAQLKLPEGFGLVIEDVLPDSPAKTAGLERNDLIVRFEDQLLVNPPQLEALIRRAGKDKEIALTILRGGAEQKVTIRIGEKMLPERRLYPSGAAPFPHQMMPGGGRPDMNLRRFPFRGDAQAEHGGGSGGRSVNTDSDRQVRYSSERARVVRSDEDGRYELTSVDGTRTFIAQKPDGSVAWTGAVQTPEQKESVPADLRKKLEMLEQGIHATPKPGESPANVIRR